MWIDKKYNLIVILLTNRVHPTRNKKGMFTIRRDFHNEIIKAIQTAIFDESLKKKVEGCVSPFPKSSASHSVRPF